MPEAAVLGFMALRLTEAVCAERTEEPSEESDGSGEIERDWPCDSRAKVRLRGAHPESAEGSIGR